MSDESIGTFFVPEGTPVKDEKGKELPLGPETLEYQRKKAKEAEAVLASGDAPVDSGVKPVTPVVEDKVAPAKVAKKEPDTKLDFEKKKKDK